MNRENVISGAITVVIGVTIFLMANSYGHHGLTADAVGPSFYPQLLGTVLAVLGLILILLNVNKKAKKTENGEQKEGSYRKNARMLFVIAAGVFYIVALQALGYLLTTFLFIVVIMFITGARSWVKIGATSVSVTLVLYLIFSQLLGVSLPLGFGL